MTTAQTKPAKASFATALATLETVQTPFIKEGTRLAITTAARIRNAEAIAANNAEGTAAVDTALAAIGWTFKEVWQRG